MSTIYRVTYKSLDGESHEEEFGDVDQGYSYFEMMQRDGNFYAVTWEHVDS